MANKNQRRLENHLFGVPASFFASKESYYLADFDTSQCLAVFAETAPAHLCVLSLATVFFLPKLAFFSETAQFIRRPLNEILVDLTGTQEK